MWWLVLIAACTEHITVPRMPTNPSAAERIALYRQWRQEGVMEETVNRESETKLVLADGIVVSAPEDLIPLLPPDGETARAADHAAGARSRNTIWKLGMVGTLLPGFAMYEMSSGSERTAGGVLLLSGLAFTVLYFVDYLNGRHQQHVVVEHYDDELAARLRVCPRGREVYACEADPGPSPTPDPSLGKLRQK